VENQKILGIYRARYVGCQEKIRIQYENLNREVRMNDEKYEKAKNRLTPV